MLWKSHSAGFGLGVGNETWTGLGDEFEVPMDHFWGQKPLGITFPEHFLRVAGFGQMQNAKTPAE